jgi:hypothetical protein
MLSHFADAPAGGGSGAGPPAAPRRPPRLLACTHLHELARPEVMAPRPDQIAFFEMKVLVGGEAAAGQQAAATHPGHHNHSQQQQRAAEGGAADAPVFLYRLAPGHSAPSFGLHCARMCGVPEPLLARAAAVIVAQREGAPVPRLALPPLAGRDARCRELVGRLAAADLGDARQVAALLAAAAGASW